APLARRPHDDQAAVGAGHRPLYQHQVVLGIDADDRQVADRDALGAVAAGHLLAPLGPAAAAVAGQRARRARLAVHLLGAVAGGQAGEVPPLHDAGGAAALAGADDVHGRVGLDLLLLAVGVADLFLDLAEDLADLQDRADLQVGRRLEAEFADELL